MATTRALQLKEEGNKCFNAKDFGGAEALYTKAIHIDSTNPLLYTNRASARIKLGLYDSVIRDCDTSLALLPQNMKPYYLLAQAEIELGEVEEAYRNAKKAYNFCSSADRVWEKDLGLVTALVLRCQKERWEKKETERLKVRDTLLEELSLLLCQEKEKKLSKLDESAGNSAEAVAELEKESADKEEELRRIWHSAADADGKRREVPDWAVDNITFAIMHDPVVTKTGQSYERASITEHLRRSPTDPLTRQPLLVEELRPNLGLKAACAEFLDQNGWAVDW